MEADEFEGVKLLRFDEAGALLGVSHMTVRRLAAEGEIETITFHSITRIPLASLRDFIDRRRAVNNPRIRKLPPRRRA